METAIKSCHDRPDVDFSETLIGLATARPKCLRSRKNWPPGPMKDEVPVLRSNRSRFSTASSFRRYPTTPTRRRHVNDWGAVKVVPLLRGVYVCMCMCIYICVCERYLHKIACLFTAERASERCSYPDECTCAVCNCALDRRIDI